MLQFWQLIQLTFDVQQLPKISAVTQTNLVSPPQQRCSAALGAKAATFQSMPQTWPVK
jgi:hypothetical protein